MKHALLLNPFSHYPELSQNNSKQLQRPARATPVCSTCRSDDIISHATAQWSNESQEWVLASTFDRPTHCNTCNAACGIKWLPLN